MLKFQVCFLIRFLEGPGVSLHSTSSLSSRLHLCSCLVASYCDWRWSCPRWAAAASLLSQASLPSRGHCPKVSEPSMAWMIAYWPARGNILLCHSSVVRDVVHRSGMRQTALRHWTSRGRRARTLLSGFCVNTACSSRTMSLAMSHRARDYTLASMCSRAEDAAVPAV